MKIRTKLARAAALRMTRGATVQVGSSPVPPTVYRSMPLDGVDIFYREAGPRDAPTIVFLHGYPSSSRMYEPLFARLARSYHLIAPDYPGFGHSTAPGDVGHRSTFDYLARTMNALLNALEIDRYTLFMQDYGGPVGFRLALAHPDRIDAMIIQNANSYVDGLGPKWANIAGYWADREGHRDQVEVFMSLEGARQRHLGDSANVDRYDPDSWTDEFASLSREGQREIQGDLLFDYQSNIAAYPMWQAWLRAQQPPLLVLWGRFDLSFIVPGARAYARDVPDAEIHILDAGHFALDEKPDDVADLTLEFLARRLPGRSTKR